MRETFKYALILGLICFLSSSVLAVINSVTEPIIKAQKEEQETQALKELLPQAAMFKPHYDQDKVLFYRAYDANNQIGGFVLKSIQRGYSSDIEILISLDTALKIVSIKILSQNETPSIGSRILELSFLEQFRNKGQESLGEVNAISAATISSAAVINSVKSKIAELQGALLEELKNGG